MRFSKTMFAVTCGILLAVAILGGLYYFIPWIENAPVRAREAADLDREERAYAEAKQQSDKLWDATKAKIETSSNPCKMLTTGGDLINACQGLRDIKQQRDYVIEIARKNYSDDPIR